MIAVAPAVAIAGAMSAKAMATATTRAQQVPAVVMGIKKKPPKGRGGDPPGLCLNPPKKEWADPRPPPPESWPPSVMNVVLSAYLEGALFLNLSSTQPNRKGFPTNGG